MEEDFEREKTMGKYEIADLKNGKWVSTGGRCATPLIRKKIQVERCDSAVITVGCLGFFELYVNGKRVGDELFLPLSTDFHERKNMYYGGYLFDEVLGHRLYCPVYDISSYLTEGENVIAFLIGPGWYETSPCGYGTVKVCFCLDYVMCGQQGTIVSDETMNWIDGFVKRCHILQGESQDFTEYTEEWMLPGFDDSKWNAVTIDTVPETALYIQDCPGDKIIRHVKPKLLFSRENSNVYDVGEIITGYAVLQDLYGKGNKITVRYGELLDEKGYLVEENTFGQYVEFRGDVKKRLLHNRFTWMCFRYFEVVGDAEVVDCQVIHSDVAVTSHFESDNEILNWIYQAYIRTQLSNMHCGIPSDCPHAERKGYTGDGQLTCGAAMLLLDSKTFYKKWIYDISDCQDRISGHVQYTAPFLWAGGGPGGWGCAIVNVPYEYYKHYGDKEILQDLYPQMIKWFSYMEEHSEAELVISDQPGAWCLGEWCTPEQNVLDDKNGIKISAPFVNTYFYIKSMYQVIEIEKILGISENSKLLMQRIAQKKQAMTETYFNQATGDFVGNEQGANAFALDIGLGDERTFLNMLKKYKKTGCYDTGIFGTDIVTRVLFERGKSDVAYSLLSSQKKVSFYRQMKSGATTLYENWNGVRSHCHPMFGAVTRYFFEYILGIRQTKDSCAFEQIVIEPLCIKEISRAKGQVKTPKGIIIVIYDEKSICVEIPENVNGILRFAGRETILKCGTNYLTSSDKL